MDVSGRRTGFVGRGLVTLLFVTLTTIGLVAPGTATAAQDTGLETRVQFLHAAPDLGKIEVAINDDERLDEYEYGQTSEWLDIEPEMVRVTISEDRAGFNWWVFDGVYPVAAGNDYYVVITDPTVIATQVDRAPLPADTARVQVLHGSGDTTAVDVAVADGEVLLEDLRYAGRSNAVEVPVGTYDLEFRASDTGDPLLSAPGITLEAGKVYQLVMMGIPGSQDHPLTLTTLVDDASTGEVAPAAEGTPTS
jgi:hypothetical protein